MSLLEAPLEPYTSLAWSSPSLPQPHHQQRTSTERLLLTASVLCALHNYLLSSSQQPYEGDSIIAPILQMNKLRLREAK